MNTQMVARSIRRGWIKGVWSDSKQDRCLIACEDPCESRKSKVTQFGSITRLQNNHYRYEDNGGAFTVPNLTRLKSALQAMLRVGWDDWESPSYVTME